MMKESTAWIVSGILILVVGSVLITGHFTRWFGLVPEPPVIETLNIGGSTTMEQIALAAEAAYEEDNPLVDVVVSGGGSTDGISGAADSSLDIGMSSRDGKDIEFTLNPDLIMWPICEDGIAVIVNPANLISQLTGDQIRGIFDGTITNWSNATAFGGSAWSDAEIDVFIRGADSGTQEVFYDWLGREIVSTADLYDTNLELKTAISESQYSIGIVGLGYIDSTVSALEIDDGSGFVAPSNNTVFDGSYPITRDLFFVTSGYPSTLAANFITYMMSEEGRAVVEERGYAPFEYLTGELTISGSTTIDPIVSVVATWFEYLNPGITVTISGGGSDPGISAAAGDTIDIGMSSRDLTSAETTANPNLNLTSIANDGIAMIVNPSNPITQLTGDQVRGIFNGTITNWSNATAFGGDAWDDAAIVVLNRDTNSGTRDVFEDWFGLDFVGSATEHTSNDAVKTAVVGSQYTIGYVGLGFVDSSVVALEINDGSGFVAPTTTTVGDATYPIIRELYLVTNGAVSTLSNTVQEFIGFMLSRTGQYIVKDENFAPLSGFIL